ncbi:hypothetical protein [Flexibacterium corallicola]|uniref:hypothetical protein n=1 Tax=Flexibacterium corallicola TaxID=3037259 RepID=UPI00286FAE9B|nr:hypothetical protein [Pseudovibrio sp. M1P-2-3]
MNYLIDNSTLSGVERLLGIAQTANLHNIDHDIVCLEKLVTAILFSDEISMVDDYKSYYADRRKKYFHYISPIKLTEPHYNSIATAAADFAKKQIIELNDAEPIGQIVSFFEQLSLKPQMRWNVFSSSEYLGITYLIEEGQKHRVATTLAAFSNEVSDEGKTTRNNSGFEGFVYDHTAARVEQEYSPETIDQLFNRIASKNPQNSGITHRNSINKLIFGFGWAAERSKFYESLSQQTGLIPCLSPLRDAYCMANLLLPPVSGQDRLLSTASENSSETYRKASAVWDTTVLKNKIPFFSSWLLSKTNNVAEVLEKALELKLQSDFKDARAYLNELQEYSVEGKKAEVNSCLKKISQSNSKILRKYCVETSNGPSWAVTLSISAAPLGLTDNGKVGGWISELYNRSHPMVRIFRPLVSDLIAVERMGELHDRATQLISRHKDATYASVNTTPTFMRKKSNDYGRPAT